MKNLHTLFKVSLLCFMVTTTQTYAETQMPANGNQIVSKHNQTLSKEDDAKITSTIQMLIKKSKTLSSTNVTVSTSQGVVMLSGTVDSDSQASGLVELAQTVRGVVDVDTKDLHVKDSDQLLTDMIITAKVKGMLIREKLFHHANIPAIGVSVETNNGVVYLTGHIDNAQQVKNLIKLIQGVKGVTKVEYNVKKITPVNKSTTPASVPVTTN